MKLAKFSLGQVISIGIAAVVFILVLKWVGFKWNIPLVSAIAKQV